MVKKFLRRSVDRFSKIGLRKKKKQVWRSPKGRDNKMREKRKGYPATVSIGYGTEKKGRGKINEKIPKAVNNLRDLEKMTKMNIAIVGKIGNKKKMEIIKKAKEKGIEIANVNSKKFLRKIERQKMFKKKIKESKVEEKKKEKAKNEKTKSKDKTSGDKK